MGDAIDVRLELKTLKKALETVGPSVSHVRDAVRGVEKENLEAVIPTMRVPEEKSGSLRS